MKRPPILVPVLTGCCLLAAFAVGGMYEQHRGREHVSALETDIAARDAALADCADLAAQTVDNGDLRDLVISTLVRQSDDQIGRLCELGESGYCAMLESDQWQSVVATYGGG